MSKNENGKPLLLEQLDAMSKVISKGENIKATCVLQDYELDLPSGGVGFVPLNGTHFHDAILC